MQTACPKCKSIVRTDGKSWTILNGACPDLAKTQWDSRPEFCPTLSQVAGPDVILPGFDMRSAVQAEIDGSRVVNMTGSQS